MSRVAVIVPVLNRPHRVKPLLASLTYTSDVIQCDPIFVVSPDDTAEMTAINEAGARMLVVDFKSGHGDYARKCNAAFKRYRESYLFLLLGADDLVFHPGWVELACAKWQATGACVIGTNDLGNRRVLAGLHSTHPLVHRDYWKCGTIDEKRKLLHEGYGHWYVDDEFVGTARARGVYAHAADSVVEHLHPNWNKAAEDTTYQKGQATLAADRALWTARKDLWGG